MRNNFSEAFPSLVIADPLDPKKHLFKKSQEEALLVQTILLSMILGMAQWIDKYHSKLFLWGLL